MVVYVLAGWSIYKVKLLFVIMRDDSDHTEVYTARDIAHNWVTSTTVI